MITKVSPSPDDSVKAPSASHAATWVFPSVCPPHPELMASWRGTKGEFVQLGTAVPGWGQAVPGLDGRGVPGDAQGHLRMPPSPLHGSQSSSQALQGWGCSSLTPSRLCSSSSTTPALSWPCHTQLGSCCDIPENPPAREMMHGETASNPRGVGREIHQELAVPGSGRGAEPRI